MKLVFLVSLIIKLSFISASPDPRTIIELPYYDGPIFVHTTPNYPPESLMYPCYNQPAIPMECDCLSKPHQPVNSASQASCQNFKYPHVNQSPISGGCQENYVPQSVSYSKVMNSADVVSMTYDTLVGNQCSNPCKN